MGVEVDLFEHKQLPGFSLVALERQIDSFQEVFQFDRLFSTFDLSQMKGEFCPVEQTVAVQNVQTLRSRLPRRFQDAFQEQFDGRQITYLEHYPALLPFLLELERAHIMSTDANGEFQLSGVYASLPSDLDTEIKRFGLKIRKFKSGDSCLYERNRLFVYQFLMELYGFPIVSERRTSAALFARRLQRMGERFLVRVQGQSDRTITTLWSHNTARHYPRVEKMALVTVHKEQRDAIRILKDGGWFVDAKNRVILLRIVYRQHKFNPLNVRQDRALSVLRQEIVHPLTGRVMTRLNIIKDTYNMVLRLTDIVRGEFTGTISYKRREIVQDTDAHDKRLKFLHFWLSKHQRRIIGYSDDFYADVVKILDSYLLNPDHFDVFSEHHDLYQEVWGKYSYIQQARKVKLMEDLLDREFKGRKVSYLEMLEATVELLNDLKFEVVNYFDELVEQVLALSEEILGDRYLIRTYVGKPEDALSDYGRRVKKNYGRLVALVDEFKAIRRSRREPAMPLVLTDAL